MKLETELFYAGFLDNVTCRASAVEKLDKHRVMPLGNHLRRQVKQGRKADAAGNHDNGLGAPGKSERNPERPEDIDPVTFFQIAHHPGAPAQDFEEYLNFFFPSGDRCHRHGATKKHITAGQLDMDKMPRPTLPGFRKGTECQ